MKLEIRAVVVALSICVAAASCAAQEASVSVRDTGVSTRPGSWECTPGHPIEKRDFALDNGAIRYSFAYSGCVDPSHGEKRPSSEGNFGMPSPTRANFYAGGFLGVIINGEDAITYRVADMQVLEEGPRGAIQAVFAHPDATVGLRLMLLPDSNHVLCLLSWRPREGATIESVQVKLTTYPSFFTSFHHRQGERHCRTPRTDQQEVSTLAIVPGEDAYLYYYDAIFDPANGEGDGPCATLLGPEGVTGGRVVIASYPVQSFIDFDPAAGAARLAFYDFAGLTNAQAQSYLDEHWQADQAELAATDFRPLAAQDLDVAAFAEQTRTLLGQAADDGEALRPRVEELLGQLETAQTQAQEGDWQAEASLSALLRDSQELLWKLRIFAMLNE